MRLRPELFATAYMIILSGCGINSRAPVQSANLDYNAIERLIHVDGNAAEWVDIKENRVAEAKHLWFGQGMEPDNWKGRKDLSFSWKSAWYRNKIYFLIQVTDDSVQPCNREYSWLNDCVEIYLDYDNRGGARIEGVGLNTPLENRIGKKLNGYEMHFLPCNPPKVFINDTLAEYRLENTQNDLFFNQWSGEIRTVMTPHGYLMEIGFSIPDSNLKAGRILGVDVAVCDDDGNGRKSLMLWRSGQTEFWITMDNFGKMKLTQ